MIVFIERIGSSALCCSASTSSYNLGYRRQREREKQQIEGKETQQLEENPPSSPAQSSARYEERFGSLHEMVKIVIGQDSDLGYQLYPLGMKKTSRSSGEICAYWGNMTTYVHSMRGPNPGPYRYNHSFLTRRKREGVDEETLETVQEYWGFMCEQ